MKMSRVVKLIPISTALVLALGAAGAAQAAPFTFEFVLPEWDGFSLGVIPAEFGSNAVLDITFDNGGNTDLSQTYLNSQITQIGVSTVGGTFSSTWGANTFAFIPDANQNYVSTDANGVATLNLLSNDNETALVGNNPQGFMQLAVTTPGGGYTPFALNDSATGAFGDVDPLVFDANSGDLVFTGFLATAVNAPPSSVPEPGTFALMGLGLLGVGLARRRQSAVRA